VNLLCIMSSKRLCLAFCFVLAPLVQIWIADHSLAVVGHQSPELADAITAKPNVATTTDAAMEAIRKFEVLLANRSSERLKGPTLNIKDADDTEGGELLVLSYSLYGNKTAYTRGMVVTAKEVPAFYPGWEVRVYHGATVPLNILAELANMTHVRLVDVTKDLPAWVARNVNPMSWRFIVASDPSVRAYGIRDGDSRPSAREKVAVDEWLRSGKAFHVMRDHPMHDPSKFATILGGMWGGLHRAVPRIDELLREYYNNNTTTRAFKYAEDQDFLWKHILPLAMNDCLQHDSYYCSESGGIAFPMTRTEAGERFDFVGNAFNRYKVGGSKKIDGRIFQKEAVDRYNKCLELRRGIIANLTKKDGTSSVLPGTPYKGKLDMSSTQLWAGYQAQQKRAIPKSQKRGSRVATKVLATSVCIGKCA